MELNWAWTVEGRAWRRRLKFQAKQRGGVLQKIVMVPSPGPGSPREQGTKTDSILHFPVDVLSATRMFVCWSRIYLHADIFALALTLHVIGISPDYKQVNAVPLDCEVKRRQTREWRRCKALSLCFFMSCFYTPLWFSMLLIVYRQLSMARKLKVSFTLFYNVLS